jgi:DNA-binding NarL/FixJ family response regulator
MLRVLVADDHPIVRKGVCEIVRNRSSWEVCAEAADGQRALKLALQEKPDVAVVDVSLPGLDGVSLTQHLMAEAPNVRVLVFTMRDDHETIRRALAAGARGYVLKSDSGSSLESAISAVSANRPFFSPSVSEALLELAMDERKRSVLDRFTSRELEIANLIAGGDGNKQIAHKLHISIKTVETHRTAAMRKSGCRSAAEFVRFAIKHNLVPA